MKKVLTLFLFTLITTITFGQSNYQDVVYLKNGNIIRGVIIEQIPNKSLKIETPDKSVFVYQIDEIEKFTKEPLQGKNKNTSIKLNLHSGYRGIIELGDQVGIGYYKFDRLFFNIINGYQINQYFFIGLGTGFRYYYEPDDIVIPVFADFKTNLTDNRVSPYLSLSIGYSFNISESHYKTNAGLILNPTFGINFNVSDKSIMNVGLGYEMQKMDIYTDRYRNNLSSEIVGAISINVGISF